MTEPSGTRAAPATDTPDAPSAVPLLAPRDGVPVVTASVSGAVEAARRLADGTGPLAVDAERASGFRYSARAYLLQFRRAGAGTVLLDPIPIVAEGGPAALRPFSGVVNSLEWVLHSADQDLPGLAELGMRPATLFDTELAGRLAGFDRVGLAAIVERVLGLSLQKGHGAADWSTRPLPDAWLNYAALDVEVLVELRDAMAAELHAQGKIDWAREEFEHIRTSGPAAPKPDRWRRTSGITAVKSPRGLAAVRELWTTRDQIAERRDIAPNRVLPDSAIVSAAVADPTSVVALRALPVFGGPRQRRTSQVWIDALERARTLPERDLPPITPPFNGPPPPGRWARRSPEAALRLSAARAGIAELSDRLAIPVENLLAPDTVRRLLWDWNGPPTGVEPGDHVDRFLENSGARPWQRALAVPVLVESLERAAAEIASITEESDAGESGPDQP